ncbi:hypothetical protein BGZ73_004326 [Actinomortierella ambigua]|nr:hypothetical protein BGZ73_004326 [Actinomortierella ambigua]
MSSDAVIEIPLLANRIFHSLPSNSRIVCLSVSKAWHAAFLPLLYKEVTIKRLKNTVELEDPVLRGVELHGHLIRELDLSATFESPADPSNSERLLEALNKHCHNLRVLRVKLPSALEPLVRKLLHNNPHLTELEYNEAGRMEPTRSLPDLFNAMSKLEKLTLHPDGGVTASELPQIGRAAPRLSRLALQHTILPDKSKAPTASSESNGESVNGGTGDSSGDKDKEKEKGDGSSNNNNRSTDSKSDSMAPAFPTLKYLCSAQGTEDNGPLVAVIRQCPNLETLRLNIGEWFKMAPVVHALGIDNVCPHLTTIEFDGSLQHAEADLVRIIRGLPPMQSIKLHAIHATHPFFKALIDRHASELKTLKLLSLNHCSVEGMHELLVRATKLEQMMVQPPSRGFMSPPVALDARVLLSSPWGCKNLNWMYLPMGWPIEASLTPEERQTIQDDEPFIALGRQFFKQLSELPRLWCLFPEGDQSTSIGFTWTLARGLGQTSTLTSLKYLSRFQTQAIGETEAAWIKQNWTSIKMYN